MRETLPPEIEKHRVKSGLLKSDASFGFNGVFMMEPLTIISSDQMGWDHVSVSTPTRCPTFDELKAVKSLFFDDEETVIQFFPKHSAYVNCHPFCLHLWKKQNFVYELPPQEMI